MDQGGLVEHNIDEGADEDLAEEASDAEMIGETDEEAPDEDVMPTDVADEISDNEDESSVRTAGNMRLRPRRRLDYQALHTRGVRQLAQKVKKVKKVKKKLKRRYKLKVRDMFRKVVSITMSQIKAASKHEQVSVEGGIRRFGNKAVEARHCQSIRSSMTNRFLERDLQMNLPRNRKIKALNLITMVKQKRCGKIKGRACADGRKERRYITKEESTSPTIHLESLMLS